MIIIGVGILQVPLIVDVLRAVLPKGTCSSRSSVIMHNQHHHYTDSAIGRLTSASVSRLLVAIVVAMCIVAIAVFFSLFLPLSLSSQGVDSIFTPLGLAHVVFVLFLWVNTVYNYYRAATLSPGYVPITQLPASQDLSSSPATLYCWSCNSPRPEHAHHCRDCNRCIVLMDHHCPFTMNCVGRDNYAHFYLFLAYVTAGLAYAAVESFPFFDDCWLTPHSAAEPEPGACACVRWLHSYDAYDDT